MTNKPAKFQRLAPVSTISSKPDLWHSFYTEMDRLFGQSADGFGFASPKKYSSGVITPVVEVNEDDKSYKIAAELPGINAEDIEVIMLNGKLILKGKKQQETNREKANYHFSERNYGAFERSYSLPDWVDHEKAAAEFTEGGLKITLPKTPQAQLQQKETEATEVSGGVVWGGWDNAAYSVSPGPPDPDATHSDSVSPSGSPDPGRTYSVSSPGGTKC